MPNVWRLTLEFEQISETGIDLFLESTQVVFANENVLENGLSNAIKDAAQNALFDITAKHAAKRANA